MHWCGKCNVFPKTAKDYLTHLHSREHSAVQGPVESPWHDIPFTDVSVYLYTTFIILTILSVQM